MRIEIAGFNETRQLSEIMKIGNCETIYLKAYVVQI